MDRESKIVIGVAVAVLIAAGIHDLFDTGDSSSQSADETPEVVENGERKTRAKTTRKQESDDIRFYSAKKVRVEGQSAKLMVREDFWVTTRLGPIGEPSDIPEVISVGDKITVENKTVDVGFISASLCLKDIQFRGQQECAKGQFRCVAVSSRQDLPHINTTGDHSWIFVKDCNPIK